MSTSSTDPRTTQQLTLSFLGKINAYALAASAAGVGMIALAQPSEAEIVFTPAHTFLVRYQHFPLDLNHDGTPDIGFFFYGPAYHAFNQTLFVHPLNGGGVIVDGPGYAAPLPLGFGIGPGRNFANGNNSRRIERTRGYYTQNSGYIVRSYGLWANKGDKYLGVEFVIDGELHYGWIRFTVTVGHNQPMDGTVTGYAYETKANQSVHAGQLSDEASVPAKTEPMVSPSLGALALGFMGLDLWRREDSWLVAQ
jgi:hypothetical protein